MIMLYKCVEEIEKIDINDYVIPNQSFLRGHSKKLYKKSLKKDVKKYSFPDKAIGEWNALPEKVVCVKNIYSFKENIVKRRDKTSLIQSCENTIR